MNEAKQANTWKMKNDEGQVMLDSGKMHSRKLMGICGVTFGLVLLLVGCATPRTISPTLAFTTDEGYSIKESRLSLINEGYGVQVDALDTEIQGNDGEFVRFQFKVVNRSGEPIQLGPQSFSVEIDGGSIAPLSLQDVMQIEHRIALEEQEYEIERLDVFDGGDLNGSTAVYDRSTGKMTAVREDPTTGMVVRDDSPDGLAAIARRSGQQAIEKLDRMDGAGVSYSGRGSYVPAVSVEEGKGSVALLVFEARELVKGELLKFSVTIGGVESYFYFDVY